MEDENKTNSQLINELAEVRQQVTELGKFQKECKQSEEEIKRNYDTQAALNLLLHLSLEDLSLEELLKRALDRVLSIPWLTFESRASIFLVEDEPNVLVMKAQRNLAEPIQRACAKIPFGKCLCGRAAMIQKIHFSDHLDEYHDITYEGIAPHGHYCTPILFAGRTLGVINIYVKEGHCRDQREEEFLTAIADTLAGIMERRRAEEKLARTMEKLRKAMGATIQVIARVAEARDPYTAGHQTKVANLARSMANELNLKEDIIDGIRMAGTIHDIGKISVPAEILSKPTKLTDIEFSLIKSHAQRGYDILKDIVFPWPIAAIVLQHHERLDGSGYPQGLKDGQILLEARILAVADVVEAMASYRPYRPALGIDAALEEIEKNKGILYDADVVDTCLKLFREKRVDFEQTES
jgi:putative nucleotidyltransferase with HDIG domain